MDNITRFVLLFEGRTGSTFIMNALDSHPNVISQGEILVGKDAATQEQIIRELYNAKGDGLKSIGFKTKLRDIADTDALLALMDEFNVKIIFMYRKNLVKLALSRLNAKRLFARDGTWNLTKGQESLPPFSPTVEEFEEALQFRKIKEEELKTFMATIRREMLVRDYQYLLDNPEQLFLDYFDYIGVEPAPLRSVVRKNTKDNMRDVLINYDEIKAHYASSPYAEMFD